MSESLLVIDNTFPFVPIIVETCVRSIKYQLMLWKLRFTTVWYLPAVLTRIIPHPRDQHQPTKQKTTDKNWKNPTAKLMTRAKIRCSAVTRDENRGAPIQQPRRPATIVPLPGKQKLSAKQSQAKLVGKTGNAALASDIFSTNELGIRWIFCNKWNRHFITGNLMYRMIHSTELSFFFRKCFSVSGRKK